MNHACANFENEAKIKIRELITKTAQKVAQLLSIECLQNHYVNIVFFSSISPD